MCFAHCRYLLLVVKRIRRFVFQGRNAKTVNCKLYFFGRKRNLFHYLLIFISARFLCNQCKWQSVGFPLLNIIKTLEKEFEKGVFTQKTHQMFSAHTTPKKSNNPSYWICVWGKLGHYYRDTNIFSFQNVFRPHDHIKIVFFFPPNLTSRLQPCIRRLQIMQRLCF